MRLGRRGAACSIVTVIVTAFLVTAAGAGAGMPAGQQASMTASPDSLSWPDATAFLRRLEIHAGPAGFAGVIGFTDAGWGGGTPGSPFGTGTATLEGPGELTVLPMPAIAPDPAACFRGAPPFLSFLPRYRLTLEPDQVTTVVATSELLAAPLPGMPRKVGAMIWPDGADVATELGVPLAIGGQSGVRIHSRLAGGGSPNRLELIEAESFRITGSTKPVLARRNIRVIAERRLDPGPGPGRVRLATVRTDAAGRFTTGALRLGPGLWVLRASLARPGRFDNTPNCAGAVTVTPSGRSPEVTVRTLDGHSFRSIRIQGRTGIGRNRIRLRFFRDTSFPGRPDRPFLAASAGCNSLGARYRVTRGRLRWSGPVRQTRMACGKRRENNDRWLIRRLKLGMKAKLNGKRLILTRGQTRIVLLQVR